jgi:hypothetical protein
MKLKIFSLCYLALSISACKSTESQNIDLKAQVIASKNYPTGSSISHGGMDMNWYRARLSSEQLSSDLTEELKFNSERKKTLIIIPNHQMANQDKDDEVSSIFPAYVVDGEVDLRFNSVLGNQKAKDVALGLQCPPSNKKGFKKTRYDIEKYIGKFGVAACDESLAYNVGILSWDNLISGDLLEIQDGLWDKKDSDYISDYELVELYSKIYSRLSPGQEVTIVGHSLGAGLAIRLYSAVIRAIEKNQLPVNSRVARVILSDPFFTSKGDEDNQHQYLRVSEIATQTIDDIWNKSSKAIMKSNKLEFNPSAAIDVYSTLLDSTEEWSDLAKDFKIGSTNLIYSELYPKGISDSYEFEYVVYKNSNNEPSTIQNQEPDQGLDQSSIDLDNNESEKKVEIESETKTVEFTKEQRLHSYPLYWVLDTMSSKAMSVKNSGKITPSGATENSKIFNIQKLTPNAYYKQVKGMHSLKTSDDVLKFSLN